MPSDQHNGKDKCRLDSAARRNKENDRKSIKKKHDGQQWSHRDRQRDMYGQAVDA